jgi:hypothetical protein
LSCPQHGIAARPDYGKALADGAAQEQRARCHRAKPPAAEQSHGERAAKAESLGRTGHISGFASAIWAGERAEPVLHRED